MGRRAALKHPIPGREGIQSMTRSVAGDVMHSVVGERAIILTARSPTGRFERKVLPALPDYVNLRSPSG